MPAPDRRIILYAITARESTIDKVSVFCKFKNKRGWCSTRRCACITAEAQYGVACHGGDGNRSLTVQILQLLTCICKRG